MQIANHNWYLSRSLTSPFKDFLLHYRTKKAFKVLDLDHHNNWIKGGFAAENKVT